jgi:Domain of unknown function (DUF4394)
VLALALLGTAAAPAHAERAVGLVGPNGLISFDTASPSNGTFRAITGLGANEAVRGIDVRPADGRLYAVTATTGSAANSVLSTYRIDPGTGAATLIGATPAALAGAGDVATGFDFNPVVDRMRYVNTNDENARLNPDTGALAGNDTDLTPAATSTIVAEAYDRNQAGAAATTLFAIDRNDSQLARQGGVDGTPSPNGGLVTDVGALGFTLHATRDAGFDIAPGGTAYAAMTSASDSLTRLYTIELATGAATAVGPIGVDEVRALAILPPEPSAPPPPPAAPPPPPPPPPVDASAPVVLVSAFRTVRLGSLSRPAIAFSCNEACVAGATLRLRGRALAGATASLGEAGVGRLRLRPTAAQRRTIRRLRRSRRPRRASLVMTFTDPSGNARRLSRQLTLRR